VVAARPASLQVGDDRGADVGGQGEPFSPVPLAGDGDLAAVPVDVLQCQARDLADAQPEAGQQRQDRQVAEAQGGARVALRQHRGHLPGG